MTDHEAIVQAMGEIGLLVDAREWAALEACFAEQVLVDYTSLQGGEPATMPRAELIGGWRPMLERLEATQHLIGNFWVELDGDTARGAANVTATHVATAAQAGDRLWTVGGRYDYGLRRDGEAWRITALTLTVRWATGNPGIMQPG
jgi:3-phenylpropionate/cinnamic acid dioxygenase small subunit